MNLRPIVFVFLYSHNLVVQVVLVVQRSLVLPLALCIQVDPGLLVPASLVPAHLVL